jgi:hypothetical protein
MREIPLTQGKVALVDDEDFERVAKYPWFLLRSGTCRYAIRNARSGGCRLMHQLILGTRGVDHVNGDGLDNRRANLRVAAQSENMRNRQKANHYAGKPTGSRFKGVQRAPNNRRHPWRAALNGRHLGYFENEREAAAAYNAAALQEFGEFARPNEV